MGKVFASIDEKLSAWINRQKLYFVSTAPLSAEGHINCSPKGLDSFRVLGPNRVAYLDLTGSGVETIAHLKENGRIVIMFCAFEGPPKIVRLHGKGRAVLPGDPDFSGLVEAFPDRPGLRSIIDIEVTRISDSCGYGVPEFAYEKDRDVLVKWADQKGEDSVKAYQQEKNAVSIDGLPGV